MFLLLEGRELVPVGPAKDKWVTFLPVGVMKQGIVGIDFYPTATLGTPEYLRFEGHKESI